MKKISGARILTLGASLAMLFLLAGCFETTEDFTLNPDGSGKVVHESKFQNVNLTGGKGNPEDQMKEAVAEVIRKSKGIDAWRDVSFKLLDDGRIDFKGTAYFPNLAELEIPNQTMLDFNWTRSPDGTGVLTLRNKKSGADGAKAAPSPVDLAKLSPDERARKLKEERAKFQQMKPMMTAFMSTMKHSVVFHLPGKPGESSNFTTDGTGALHLEFDGAKMLQAMDTLISDDAWMAKNSASFGGQDAPAIDERLSQLLFGGKGPVRAAVSGLAGSSFDYAAEVAEAKKDSAAITQQLGASPVAAVAPAAAAQGGELKAVKVVGVRLVREVDEQREIQPFGAGVGYTLSVLAELPGRVLDMADDCGLDTAVGDDGSDLLPDDQGRRQISFPKLSADKTAVLIEVELKTPGAGVKGVRELSGHLQYKAAGGTKEVELGLGKFAADAQGKQLGARIESIKGDSDGSQSMDLHLQIEPGALKAVYLTVGQNKTELKQRGYSGGGDSFTYTFESETGFPAKGRLSAEVYDQLQTYSVPFKLENISLLGEPLDAK